VEYIWPETARNLHNPFSQRAHLAPFSDERRSCGLAGCAVKDQAIDQLGLAHRWRPFLPLPGNAQHIVPCCLLRLQNSAGAKCIAALERQAVIEDMEYAGHGDPIAMRRLNAASTVTRY
jgi:hypothetical protein